MKAIKALGKMFTNNCTYKTINKLSDKKLRNIENGITLQDALYYRFLYTKINTTKQENTSNINMLNDTNYTRQSFESKENNIPLNFYELLLYKIKNIYNKCIMDTHDTILMAVDGVNNNDNNNNVMLNLGIFNISNNVPVDVTYFGKDNRNKEVKVFMEYITINIKKYKNVIFIADRLYFNYELLTFLNDNNLKYIIRVKGDGSNVDNTLPLKKHTPKYDIINNLRETSRLVKCKKIFKKTVYAGKSKRSFRKAILTFKNDCVLITNLKDNNKYTDSLLLNYYRSRWDIEVYFKLIKYNFKFQYINTKDIQSYKKMYICELIISYILKLIENYYWSDKKQNDTIIKKNGDKIECTEKINKSNVIKGIFDNFLYDILKNNINESKLKRFCELYIITVKNEKNRSFPRNSKIPFTKWYIKGYSEPTKYARIVDALINKTVNKLDKNLKMIANKIVSFEYE